MFVLELGLFLRLCFLQLGFLGADDEGAGSGCRGISEHIAPTNVFFGRGLIFLQRLFLGSFFLLSKVSEGR